MNTARAILAVLAVSAASVVVSAQSPQGAGQQAPAAQTPATQKPATPAAAGTQATTTLVGCLYREEQIPGRKPNVVEKAGILEDYVLADATIAGAKTPASSTPGATGTSGKSPSTGSLYKVDGPPDEQLKALVGKRVEVTGRIDPEGGSPAGGPSADKGPGPDDINLPDIQASSIREVSGTCPATPTAPK
jgi:hypothetical protein